MNPNTMSFNIDYEEDVSLTGGICSSEDNYCTMYGGQLPTDHITYTVAWSLSWNGEAWVAAVDRSHSYANVQCKGIDGMDFEPWAFNLMRLDQIYEFADYLESVSWECPS